MNTQSMWLGERCDHPTFPNLTKSPTVDVAIVGGGIAGITAGILLMRAGKTVAVLEHEQVGGGETGHSTAHLTEILDTRYHKLISDFGLDGAKAARHSTRAAIDMIEFLISEYHLTHCGFARVDGYLFTDNLDGVADIKSEAEALQTLGADVSLINDAPLPFPTLKALKIAGQAQFQPYNYVAQLATILSKAPGCSVFEHTRVSEVKDGTPCVVSTDDGHRVTAQNVIVAANTPVNNWIMLHTKVAAYRSYAIAAKIPRPLTRALFWDNANPYHYIRTCKDQNGGDCVIVGGEDHKTGTKSDTNACFEKLEGYARERLGISDVLYRWSGQIIEPADGLPYIGRNSMSKNTYVATGFSGNGLTFGTLAGMLLLDEIGGVENEWHKLYTATRIHPLASAAKFVTENACVVTAFIKDNLSGAEAKSTDEVHTDEGKIVTCDGDKCAVYRDEDGTLHTLSAICPHMGCVVHFNSAEKTWDCPCHGSRFDAKGKVINGPAVTDLKAHATALK